MQLSKIVAHGVRTFEGLFDFTAFSFQLYTLRAGNDAVATTSRHNYCIPSTPMRNGSVLTDMIVDVKSAFKTITTMCFLGTSNI